MNKPVQVFDYQSAKDQPGTAVLIPLAAISLSIDELASRIHFQIEDLRGTRNALMRLSSGALIWIKESHPTKPLMVSTTPDEIIASSASDLVGVIAKDFGLTNVLLPPGDPEDMKGFHLETGQIRRFVRDEDIREYAEGFLKRLPSANLNNPAPA